MMNHGKSMINAETPGAKHGLTPAASALPAFLSRNLYHHVKLDGIVLMEIIEAFKYKTAFVACVDLFYIVLKPL